jgi:translation initiation factor 1A
MKTQDNLRIRNDKNINKKSEKIIMNNEDKERELLFKLDGQEYAQVLRILGNGRIALSSFDGIARTGLIKGKMLNEEIEKGNIVLIGLREFQHDKADVIYKYTSHEIIKLQTYGELPVFFTKFYKKSRI